MGDGVSMSSPETMIKLLEEICRIDSRTQKCPEGVCRVGDILAEQVRTLGFECQRVSPRDDEMPRGTHVVAERNRGGSPRIVLIGHMDTVLSPEEVPLRLDTDEGRMYGSGVSDMKGGIVVMLEALRQALDGEGAAGQANLVVVLNASEETPTVSFGEMLRGCCEGAAACLNFEPCLEGPSGAHAIVRVRKGINRGRLTCRGRSAHAGNHHARGANAIRELARKVEAIESLTNYDREVTANVGVVSGGQTYNQVADLATAEFEVRGFHPGLMAQMKADVESACREASVRSGDGKTACSLELEWLPGFPPLPANPKTDELLGAYVRTARDVAGLRCEGGTRGGAADCNFVADMVPVLDGLGVLGGEFHTPWEWADVSSMAARASVAGAFLEDLCAGASP